MSAILALVTITVLIVIGWFRSKKSKAHVEEVIVPRYIHPGHTWARVTEDGDVLVGIDDFGQSLIGTIDEVKVPRLLRKVRQGEVAWRVWHGHRQVGLVSPVNGRVIEKNEMVLRNPSLVNTAPYGDGWLLRIKPRRFSAQLNNLMTGKPAHQWLDVARARLSGFFATTPALMYQDGGVLLKDFADRCSDEEWHRLTKEFFLTQESQS
jgi:glycine cleavage system H protein